MAEEIRTAYWAVIPAPVRHDPELRPNAKLLYAEISSLCDQRGYCWATNERLGEIFGVGAKTASELISQLEKHGYITVEIIRNERGQIKQRRLRLREIPDADEPLPKNRDTSPEKSGEERFKKNVSTPLKPPQTGDWMPDTFAALWKGYPRHESKQAALRAWNRLKPSEELIGVIAAALKRQMASELWSRGIGIPYLSTWLNQARWEDEIGPAAAEPPAREELPIL